MTTGAAFADSVTVSSDRIHTEVTPLLVVDDMNIIRYDSTAQAASVDASRRSWATTAHTVYLVNPGNTAVFAALTSVGATTLGGPVLYTSENGTLPENTILEIARLHPQRIVAIGDVTKVSDNAVTAARDAAVASTKTKKGVKAVDVTTQRIDSTDPLVVSRTVVSGLTDAEHPVRTVYAVAVRWEKPGEKSASGAASSGAHTQVATSSQVRTPTVQTLMASAIAGSIDDGVVLLVDEGSSAEAKTVIDAIAPEFVTLVGDMPKTTADALSAGRKKSVLKGQKPETMALDAASLRALVANSSPVVVPVDDPVSILIGATTANGPLVGVEPTMTVRRVNDLVRTVAELSGVTTRRYVAIGAASSGVTLFDPHRTGVTGAVGK